MFGFLKKYDAHLCSAVSGRIVNKGKALAGAKIVRELRYTDKKKRIDSALTDKHGNFYMPEINVRSKAPGWSMVDQRTMQYITLKYQDKYYSLWEASLGGIEKNTAFDDKLKKLNAELSDSSRTITFINLKQPSVDFYATSICRWEKDASLIDEGNED